jgi:ribosomal protein S12 methylthiotransferase
VVKYIDMPLQHINDEILMKMRRRVTRREIETLLEKLRKWVPGIAIRTTFIAGSPGETDAQHEELVKFVKEFGFEMMGVFPYSREPGTPMARMEGQVSEEVKQGRVEELMLAQQGVAFGKAKGMVGRTVEVLIDRPAGRDEEDGYVGRTSHQAPDIDSVTFVHGEGLHAGMMADVRVTDYQAYDLVGEVGRKRARGLKVIKA